MVVQLSKPEIEQFIAEQVQAGNFPSPDAAVEAAIEEIMLRRERLDDETITAIKRADEQYAAGQFVECDDVKDGLRKKYLGK